MFHLKWIREIFEACHTIKSLDTYKRLNVPDMEWMKKALEACDITEALIENTGYIWTRMDTEAPEIISEYWTLTLDGENKTKQNKTTGFVWHRNEETVDIMYSSETRWLSMVSILISVGATHLISSKPWNTGGWWTTGCVCLSVDKQNFKSCHTTETLVWW